MFTQDFMLLPRWWWSRPSSYSFCPSKCFTSPFRISLLLFLLFHLPCLLLLLNKANIWARKPSHDSEFSHLSFHQVFPYRISATSPTSQQYYEEVHCTFSRFCLIDELLVLRLKVSANDGVCLRNKIKRFLCNMFTWPTLHLKCGWNK